MDLLLKAHFFLSRADISSLPADVAKYMICPSKIRSMRDLKRIVSIYPPANLTVKPRRRSSFITTSL